MTTVLSSAYFPPIEWFQQVFRADHCVVDAYEPFQKQSYRNRCLIGAPQGVQALSVPVSHDFPSRTGGDSGVALMRDIRISDHGNWRHNHWNALCSAYGTSPFFEFYADDIRPFFEKRWTFLFDFNMEITQCLCELLELDKIPEPSTAPIIHADCDLRQAIQPKNPLKNAHFIEKKYIQPFIERNGFQSNLSVLDLLFCLGNEAPLYL